MQNLILGSWAMVSCLVIRAQGITAPQAAPYPSMTAYSRSFTDALSPLSQPASLVSLQRPSVALYGERRFLLPELGYYQLGLGIPAGSGRFGLLAAFDGNPLSSRSSVSLGYARRLGKLLDLGLRFNYHAVRLAGYGQAQAPSVDGGARLQVTDKLQAGFSVLHFSRNGTGKNNEGAPPLVVALGAGCELSAKLFLTAQVEKEAQRPASLVAGFLYRVLPLLELRAGIASATSQVWCGAGIRVRSMMFHAIAQYHPQLGFTPSLLLVLPGAKPAL